MQHVFWLIPDMLAGRSGPTKYPWRLAELKKAGIGAVLSVNDGQLCRNEDFSAQGLRYKCVPLSSNAPPAPGDLEHCVTALPQAYRFVEENEANSIATLVHCRSGKDRTGLFMAYYLCRKNKAAPVDAIARVKAVRSIAFTAQGWEFFSTKVLTQVAA